ncbi:MAG: hypothetical protein KC417_03825 [Myxococcales bacterium]|nr:hypothetical protein [Myxococcales bacterium]
MSIWVAAGAGDTTPPSNATVAAWLAAEPVRAVQSAVFPHATLFRTTCPTRALDECTNALSKALGRRQLGDGDLGRAREWLKAARARDVADTFRSERLALDGLLDDVLPGLEPLDRASTDGAITDSTVQEFWASFYGKPHAMLVIEGDGGDADVEHAAHALAMALPTASGRYRAPATPEDGDAVRVEEAPRGGASVAVGARSIEEASRIAALFDRGAPHGTRTRVFPLGGGSTVLATLDGDFAIEDIERAANGLLRARADVADDPRANLPPSPELAGTSWADARHPPRTIGDAALGIALAPKVRGDVDRWKREGERALAGARALTSPKLSGALDTTHADVRLTNGVRIVAEQRPRDRTFAMVLGFEGGAASEPLPSAGESAVLAEAAALLCGEDARARVHAARATVRPWVDARGWGIRVEGGTPDWRETLDAALSCFALAALPDATVERARLAAIQRNDAESPAVGAASKLLFPNMPGLIDAGGEHASLDRMTAERVQHAWRSRAVGARMRVAIMGPLEVGPVVRFTARRLASRTTGDANQESNVAPVDANQRVLSEDGGQGHPPSRAVVGWRAPAHEDTTGERDAALKVCADATARTIAARGYATDWHVGGSFRGTDWVALAIDLRDRASNDIPRTLQGIATGAERVFSTVAAEHNAHARAELGDPAHAAALRLDVTGAAGTPDPEGAADCGALLRTALRVHFFVDTTAP